MPPFVSPMLFAVFMAMLLSRYSNNQPTAIRNLSNLSVHTVPCLPLNKVSIEKSQLPLTDFFSATRLITSKNVKYGLKKDNKWLNSTIFDDNPQTAPFQKATYMSL